MKSEPVRLADYLEHIVQGIDRIGRHVASSSEAEFFESELVQDAVIRNLEVIGEASRNIQINFPEFAAAHSQLPLASAYQMRNAVAHGYFKVDLAIVWRTVQTDLLTFIASVVDAINALPPGIRKT
jgi:uncharacterized protein with HEPN domain